MHRLIFAVVICGASASEMRPQAVPARDLLAFPLGALAEAPALSMQLTSGLWNPAAIGLRRGDLIQIGIAALNSPVDQGVSEQLGSVAIALPRDLVGIVSIARASISDLTRTATDPQSVGGAIQYGTTLGSLGLARRFGTITVGVAARYRSGTVDNTTRSAASFDGGVVIDHALGTPLRFAASTFLLTPRVSQEAATLLGAVDTPLYSRDTTLDLRVGLAASSTKERGYERYVFAAIHYANVEARGGIARAEEFGSITDHVRLGLSLRYGRYSVGIAREEQGAGLGATYQFLLTSVYP